MSQQATRYERNPRRARIRERIAVREFTAELRAAKAGIR